MHALLDDLRLALRLAARRPGFAAAAIGTLALGVAASTSVFAVLHGVLLRPLPLADPDRLVTLSNTIPASGVGAFPFSLPEFVEHRDRNESLAGLTVYSTASLALTGEGPAERVPGARVASNFFDVLGVAPAIGRAFDAADAEPGAPCVVLLRHGYWTMRFAASPAIVGTSIVLDDASCEVRGVLPREFRLPSTADVWLPAIITPAASGPAGLGRQLYRAIGRLAAPVTPAEADAVTNETARRFHAQHAGFYSGSPWVVTLTPLADQVVGDVSATLLVLMAGAGLMLAIACANVAQLLLARLLSRGREFALRGVLGASTARLFRQVLVECALFGLAGGLVGLVLSAQAIQIFLALGAGQLPRAESIGLDRSVALFALGTSVALGLVIAIAPAIRAARRPPSEAFRVAVGGGSAGRSRLREGLVVGQVAVTLVLATGATLMARSLDALMRVDPGFAVAHRLVAHVAPPASRYPDAARRAQLFDEIVQAASVLPGVSRAGGVSALPFSGQDPRAAFRIDGWTTDQAARATDVHYRLVAGAYFEATGMRLVRGRWLAATDGPAAPGAAVVNAALASRFWPAGDALGQRISFDRGEHWFTIVGVADDVKHLGLDADPDIEVFLPYAQAAGVSATTMTIVVHAPAAPTAIPVSLRTAVSRIDARLPLHGMQSMEAALESTLARPRWRTGLTSLFALLGLLLAGVGTFSVLTQMVTERAYELAVRAALGASRGRLAGLTLARGFYTIGAGLVIGVAVTAAAANGLASMLYGVSTHDPRAYVSAAALVSVTGLVAVVLPARRAWRVNPLRALGHER